MHGREIGGSAVKIGYAKVPSNKDSSSPMPSLSQTPSLAPLEWQDSAGGSAHARSISMSATTSWAQASGEYIQSAPESLDTYALSLPPIPESSPDRKIDNGRMRDFRKRLESTGVTSDHVAEIFNIVIQDAVSASAGNFCDYEYESHFRKTT